MYVVRENGDGTVTIDRKVYEELYRRACAEKKEYTPLTPDIREIINHTIDQNIIALDACKKMSWVEWLKDENERLRRLVNALPDGYPLPLMKNEGGDADENQKN